MLEPELFPKQAMASFTEESVRKYLDTLFARQSTQGTSHEPAEERKTLIPAVLPNYACRGGGGGGVSLL